MTCKAYIVKVDEITPHPNADRLSIASIKGYHVVVGTNTKVDDCGILFLPDAVLTDNFTQGKFKFVPASEYEYLHKNRVRAVKLRNIYSEGMFVPMVGIEQESMGVLLSKYPNGELPEGELWTSYIPESNYTANPDAIKYPTPGFTTHLSTKHLREEEYWLQNTNSDLKLTVTRKKHGISHRVGKLQPNSKNLTIFEKISQFVTRQKIYKISIGSRRDEYNISSIDDVSFRHILSPVYDSLYPDEIIYGEIVGYYNNQKKTLMARYKRVAYDYGIPEGENRFEVYRITQNGVDLEQEQMMARASRLGLKCSQILTTTIIRKNDLAYFRRFFDYVYLESEEFIHDSFKVTHTEEGVCVRVERINKDYTSKFLTILKHKYPTFILEEGITR